VRLEIGMIDVERRLPQPTHRHRTAFRIRQSLDSAENVAGGCVSSARAGARVAGGVAGGGRVELKFGKRTSAIDGERVSWPMESPYGVRQREKVE
jgi:hypothetical protein